MISWLEQLIERAATQKESNKNLFEVSTTTFVYGTGSFAQDVYQVLLNNGIPVYGFIDHLEQKLKFINGKPIYTPEKAAEIRPPNKAIIVLGIHNYQADISRIVTRLGKAGFKRILTSVDLYDFFGSALGVRYWLTSRDSYFSLQAILEEACSLWADRTSLSLFKAVMEFRLTGNVSKLPSPDLVNPYHPADLPAWQYPLRFVDCGAFDGDTLADFLRNNINIQKAAAFEPDLANFARLSRFISTHQNELTDVILFPCGVYSSTRQLSFETGRGMASYISNKGTMVIQCLALDDAIPTFYPNLIKMDIEGAEYDALLGAREIITTHTPGLAISLYHRPEHLWQLPLLIASMAPNKYQFHIRSHALNDFELVLYAIPKD
jgi:FkbM family methyltransferase